MSATALTADEEIRRLRKIAEATRDLSRPCPRLTPHAEPSVTADLLTAFAQAIAWSGERLRRAARVRVARDAWAADARR
jgi:hypothetical protein